jgi:LmbE family N-acetylglucosaminyl deacetylase
MRTLLSTWHPPRILGVFAHPDDESFCAGGTFAKYAAAGAEIMVVSATRGEAGQIRDARAATRRTLGAVRERELSLASQRLGIQHAVCLDYGDGTLKDVAPQQLTRDVVRIVREFKPDVVITFGPDGGYGHPDHIAIGAATTTACALAGDAAAFPEQLASGLAPHRPAALFHSHFPRSPLLLHERLVQWLVGQDERFRGSFDFAQAVLLLAEETSVLGYTSDHVDVQWYPDGFYMVEQGEPANRLYLILSGVAEVVREDADGGLRAVAQLGPGTFFGEEGLAYERPRNAHVVARGSVTCLVFAPAKPTAFAGRGASASLDLDTASVDAGVLDSEVTTAIDVSAYVERKIAAIAAHRTQYPISPTMLPLAMLQEMMGREYFVRVIPTRVLESELLIRSDSTPMITLGDRNHIELSSQVRIAWPANSGND